MTNAYKLILGMSLISLVWGQALTKDCKKVLANPQDYPITYINECTEETTRAQAPSPRSRARPCRKFACTNTCIFGWQYDLYGCPTCQCVRPGQEGKFEGDITVTDVLREYISDKYENPDRVVDTTVQRGAARSLPLWKMYPSGNNYVVPYIISSSIGSSGRSAIAAAAADFAKYTCIRLQPRSSQGRYINFYRGGGCSSPVGAVSTRQDVSLASGCWYKGTVIHEVLHSLGFWHEQSRPDRDSYVRINTNNISPSLAYNFNKFSTAQIDSMGSAYDTRSVMHYNSYAFSTNGQPTITDLQGRPISTQRNGFAQSDIDQLNQLYGCKVTGGGGGGGGGGGTGTGGSCTDSNSNCAYWAKTGECTRNPAYMGPNCCKSCKGTTTVTTTTRPPTTTTTTTTTTRSTCVDTNRLCSGWASNNECQRNPRYMLKYCCKSCRAPPVVCTDENSMCARWAQYRYCQGTYQAFMSKYCKKSCQLC